MRKVVVLVSLLTLWGILIGSLATREDTDSQERSIAANDPAVDPASDPASNPAKRDASATPAAGSADPAPVVPFVAADETSPAPTPPADSPGGPAAAPALDEHATVDPDAKPGEAEKGSTPKNPEAPSLPIPDDPPVSPPAAPGGDGESSRELVASATIGTMRVLTLGRNYPNLLEQTDADLFWTEYKPAEDNHSYAILTMPKSGGHPWALVGFDAPVRSFGVDADALYYAKGDVIYRHEHGSDVPTELTAPERGVVGLWVHGGYVYWNASSKSQPFGIWQIPTAGGKTRLVAQKRAKPPMALAVHDKNIYYGRFYSGAIARTSLRKRAPNTIIRDAVGVDAMRVTDDGLFWAVRNCYCADQGEMGIFRLPHGGRTSTTLFAGEDGEFDVLAVDDAYVYWSSQNVPIKRVPIDGGDIEVITSGGWQWWFVLDGDTMYATCDRAVVGDPSGGIVAIDL